VLVRRRRAKGACVQPPLDRSGRHNTISDRVRSIDEDAALRTVEKQQWRARCQTEPVRAALGVFRANEDRSLNLARMTDLCERAGRGSAGLVVFSEAAVTGFAGRDDAHHDVGLGEPVPGPATAALGSVARRLGLWVAFGLFEREDTALYDSAVLIDPAGDVQQVYQRIDPHWHRPDADAAVYRQGAGLAATAADFGTVTLLICGGPVQRGRAAPVRCCPARCRTGADSARLRRRRR
jgi:hypothetical protein